MLPLELTWEAPAECPDATFVVRRVEQIVVPGAANAPVSARGIVTRADGGRFVLVLTLRTGELEDTRTVDAAACTALADASAVVIALALAPDPPPDPIAAASPTYAPAPAPAPPPAPHLLLDAGAVIEPGPLPSVGGGLELAAGMRVGRLRLAFRGAAWLPQDAVFAATGAGATFTMLQGGAFGAWVFPLPLRTNPHALGLGPEVGVDADVVRVSAFGIRDPRSAWTSWPTAAVGARAEARLTSWLGVVAHADLVVAFETPTFTLRTAEGRIPVHDPAAAYPRLGLAAEIRLP